MAKLIILDRDGVINHDSDDYIRSLDEFIAIDGSLNAISRLNQAGFIVTIATNQSGIGRGYYSAHTFEQMSKQLKKWLKKQGGHIDYIAHCPHQPQDNCLCRKPKTGMYQDIAKRFQINLNQAIVVGDSDRDIQAGLIVGAQCFLVKTGKGEKTLQQGIDERVTVCQDLAAVVTLLLKN